ncbi:YggS family pyridoxal phosphate-dependent enzyme [Terrihabitans sp. B22-R8]|uniref:YggS family pyridoxal phosphate-dependent enzyme n=1 Tax=Terrihabitans sp. B22-R8 TaxID=3425128 RepID=UPI00403D161C
MAAGLTDMETAAERVGAVRTNLAQAVVQSGRDEEACGLVVVSKTFDADAVAEVLGLGERVFGENRVQEAAGKWPQLRARYADIELHLIGPLQSNKVREAVELFDVIQSVDRPKIAQALAAEMERQQKRPKLFVQVNTGAEPQKAGVLPEDVDAFVQMCRDDLKLSVAGLMCIPPVEENPAPHFALLEKIARRNGLTELSMGMSGDYEIAARFGATCVRVGSAIFGARPPLPDVSGPAA